MIGHRLNAARCPVEMTLPLARGFGTSGTPRPRRMRGRGHQGTVRYAVAAPSTPCSTARGSRSRALSEGRWTHVPGPRRSPPATAAPSSRRERSWSTYSSPMSRRVRVLARSQPNRIDVGASLPSWHWLCSAPLPSASRAPRRRPRARQRPRAYPQPGQARELPPHLLEGLAFGSKHRGGSQTRSRSRCRTDSGAASAVILTRSDTISPIASRG